MSAPPTEGAGIACIVPPADGLDIALRRPLVIWKALLSVCPDEAGIAVYIPCWHFLSVRPLLLALPLVGLLLIELVLPSVPPADAAAIARSASPGHGTGIALSVHPADGDGSAECTPC